MSPWALALPILALGLATVLPALVVQLVARRAMARAQDSPEDKLHRIRRAALAAVAGVPLVVLLTLALTRTTSWLDLALTEAGVESVPAPALARLTGMLGILGPVVLGIAGATVVALPYDRELRGTRQTTRDALAQTLRGLALVLVPLVIWQVVLAMAPDLSGVALVAMALVFAFTLAALGPAVMNTVLRTTALEDSARRRILDACARQGLRVRDVRKLDSHGGRVANAAISGVLPRFRYVFVTDHLLEILDEDELDAVLAHEIAHGKRHHLLIRLGATFAAIGALMGLVVVATSLADLRGRAVALAVAVVLPVAMLLVLVVVQGVVGVAQEGRADDHAVRTVGAPALARALEKIADANKVKRRTGWLWNVLQQHPGMEQRPARLREDAARTGPPGRSQDSV